MKQGPQYTAHNHPHSIKQYLHLLFFFDSGQSRLQIKLGWLRSFFLKSIIILSTSVSIKYLYSANSQKIESEVLECE